MTFMHTNVTGIQFCKRQEIATSTLPFGLSIIVQRFQRNLMHTRGETRNISLFFHLLIILVLIDKLKIITRAQSDDDSSPDHSGELETQTKNLFLRNRSYFTPMFN